MLDLLAGGDGGLRRLVHRRGCEGEHEGGTLLVIEHNNEKEQREIKNVVMKASVWILCQRKEVGCLFSWERKRMVFERGNRFTRVESTCFREHVVRVRFVKKKKKKGSYGFVP